ncbi:MAG: NUDIX domain-containing protein, partial [Ignavibacteriales bacterium]|nr:NUDIX domain-containing protein [Ignavibacteriales bacterium]
LQRELLEELSIRVRRIEKMDFRTSRYDDGGTFEVAYCHISEFDGEPKNNVFEQIRWVEPRELSKLDILEGNRSIVAALTHE